jgi:hypothetical protein
VINVPPIIPRPFPPAALSRVAKGLSFLLVIPRAWTRLIPATVIWAPESAMACVWADLLVTLGRGKESS